MTKLDITCVVSGADTGGAVAVFAEVVPPGGGPPRHAHRDQVEIFHIIEGKFRFLIDGEEVELGAGASAVVPKGAVHAFKNVGEEAGRIHFELLPSGKSEEGFARLVDEGDGIGDIAAFFDDTGSIFTGLRSSRVVMAQG